MTHSFQSLHFKDNINYFYVNRITVEDTNHVDFIHQFVKTSYCTQNNDNFDTSVNSKIMETSPIKVTEYIDFKKRTYGPLLDYCIPPREIAEFIPHVQNDMAQQEYINIEFYEACYPIEMSLFVWHNSFSKKHLKIWAQISDDQWFLLSNKGSFLSTSVYSQISLWPCDFKTKMLKLELSHDRNDTISYAQLIKAVMFIGTSEFILPTKPKQRIQRLNNFDWNFAMTDSNDDDKRACDPYLVILLLQENFDKYCIICKSDIMESFHKSKLGCYQVSQQTTAEVPYFRHLHIYRFLKNYSKKCVKNVKPSLDESKELLSCETASRKSFSALPNEIVLKILKKLDVTSLTRLGRVNKRFNNLSQNSSLYKCLNLRDIYFTNMHTSLCQLFNYFAPRCEQLQHLDLAYCHFSDSKFREFLKTCCRNLTHLQLSNCNIIDSVLRDISKICTNLKDLDLNYCRGITNEGILYLKNLQYLERLHLEDISLEANTLCKILQKNRQMRDLNLRRTKIKEDLKIDTIAIELKNSCPNLERLDLKGCILTSQAIDALADCKNLKEVYFTWCKITESSVNDDILSKLFSSCQRLEIIDLSKFKELTKRDWITLASCKNLKSLYLESQDSVTPDIISQLFEKCLKLNEIDLSSCRNISESFVDQWNETYNNVIVYRNPKFILG